MAATPAEVLTSNTQAIVYLEVTDEAVKATTVGVDFTGEWAPCFHEDQPERVPGSELGHYLGTIYSVYPNHGWIVASYIVVGVMAVIALGLLEPANVAVLFELKKERPNPAVIQKLMTRFIYTAAITGAMQVATLVIMTKLRAG